MNSYRLSHLTDHVLLRDLALLVSQDRATTAAMLAHLAEVDERKLYLPKAYASMYLYCVKELRMSEDTAFKRIRAARTARRFPEIFAALADGRLHLGAVVQLSPHLTPETADELLAAATHKTKAEIDLLLARRFPQPDVLTHVQAIAPAGAGDEAAMRPVDSPAMRLTSHQVAPSIASLTTTQVEPLAPGPPVPSDCPKLTECVVPLPSPAPIRAKLAPLSPGRFALQVTVDQHTHDQLRHAQAMLGHALPSGDVAEVLKRALDLLVEKLERRKFAKAVRTRPDPSSGWVPRGEANDRYVPAEVRRTVSERDGGQCTFVGENGQRCESRTRLEFDHVDAVGRSGETTAANMRLLCRAHNQFEAERTYGAEFMRSKRQDARCKAAQAKTRGRAIALHAASARSALRAPDGAHGEQPWLK